MQSSSIRYVQHHLADVLKLVEAGEEVRILRRNKAVAKIVPIENPVEAPVDWSAHAADINKIFSGRQVDGKPMAEIVGEARGEN